MRHGLVLTLINKKERRLLGNMVRDIKMFSFLEIVLGRVKIVLRFMATGVTGVSLKEAILGKLYSSRPQLCCKG